MSLFGIIPIQEIRDLASKCEKYMQRFLEDKSEKKEEGTVEDKKEAENVPPEGELDPQDPEAKSNNNNVSGYL